VPPHTRRQFLHDSCRLGAIAAAGATTNWSDSVARLGRLFDPPPDDPFIGGTKLATLRFEGRGSRTLETHTGRGLTGRYSIDLARLDEDALIVDQSRFYVRTAAPEGLDLTRPWSVRVHGLAGDSGQRPTAIPLERFERLAKPRGVHLLECSGNAGSFGLMSAAEWDGVLVSDMLETLPHQPENTRVLISGYDKHTGRARNSKPGASWVFTRSQLQETGAFFATRMNGQPLTPDHGQPLRLVVPGWYGCTCIKWIDEIRFVDDDLRATPQMREFANRTHQPGIPRLARDFRPAEIDLAATPIRVEKWRVDGSTLFRIVGIVWGGKETTNQLSIRFARQRGERFRTVGTAPVDHCEYAATNTWSLWWHAWNPRTPGQYRITMHVDDPTIRTRRLDRGFYARTIRIED
jgi:DMSO/TMAO reductase YedYZ molybdopterin-dependent catalytic subunit